MTEKKEFCQCLDSLLSTLGISISRLAKSINVDNSLVNRWVNGKRIPAYNTIYIEVMAEYLSKNIRNSIQMQQVNDLFISMFGDTKVADTYKEKTKKILLESQGYSIENREKRKKEGMNSPIAKNQGNRIRMSPYYESQSNFMEQKSNSLNNVLGFSGEDKVLLGIDNILHAGISLLEFAANQRCKNNNKIYITYNNDLDMTIQYNDLFISYKNALLKSIENGWNIVLLLRLDNILSKTVRIINFIRPLLATGKISIYYIDRYDIFDINNEGIIVSEIGALSCFRYKLNPKQDSAFYFRSNAAVEALENNFNIFLSTYGKPILKYFSQEGCINYNYYLADSENNAGNRFLYKYNFSVITLPRDLYKKLLSKKGLSKKEIQIALDFYDRRLSAFIQNIQIYEYNDIHYIDSIYELIKYRHLSIYDYTGVETIDLEMEEVVEILHNIINFLETYRNYKVALISKDIYSPIEGTDFYCLVKERQAVICAAFKPSNGDQVRLTINEPTIVLAFEEYFKDLMRKVTPLYKDKKEIILWIKKQIALIRNNYSNELFNTSHIYESVK